MVEKGGKAVTGGLGDKALPVGLGQAGRNRGAAEEAGKKG